MTYILLKKDVKLQVIHLFCFGLNNKTETKGTAIQVIALINSISITDVVILSKGGVALLLRLVCMFDLHFDPCNSSARHQSKTYKIIKTDVTKLIT